MWQAETKRWGDWETYHEALIQCKMALRRAKRCSLRNCCGLIEVCETSRLVKICSLDCVRTAGGERSSLPDVMLSTCGSSTFSHQWMDHAQLEGGGVPVAKGTRTIKRLKQRVRDLHTWKDPVGNRKARVIQILRGRWSMVCLIADWFWNYSAP